MQGDSLIRTWCTAKGRSSTRTVTCHVCARDGALRSDVGGPWCCWDCRDALIAQKALCGAHVICTYEGLIFSDQTGFTGFFVD